MKENKGHFPYELFDDLTKLERTSLPPHETFYSSLKQTNISDEEYKFCQSVWTENSMTTFRDFLVWYNYLDVGPFVTAVENLQRYYFKRNINIFKVSISVPTKHHTEIVVIWYRKSLCTMYVHKTEKISDLTITKNTVQNTVH